MFFFDSSGSPFLLFWYFFLGFLALVIAANILALLAKLFIQWRTKRLESTALSRGKK